MRKSTVTVAFAGVEHWHTPLYWAPALADPSVKVVGVSGDPEPASRYSTEAGCPSFASADALVESTRPDLVFALGPHHRMAELGQLLVDHRVPFVLEKPCGLDFGEVERLAEAARTAGIFNGVPLMTRISDLGGRLLALVETGGLEMATFRFIGGPADRYRRWNCDWMLEARSSGGGSMRNLGAHFLDLPAFLLPTTEAEVVAAAVHDGIAPGVEDYGVVTVRAGDALITVETGYGFPGSDVGFDLRFSVKCGDRYLVSPGLDTIELFQTGRDVEVVKGTTTVSAFGSPLPGHYVEHVLDSLRRDHEPCATVADAARVARLTDIAYTRARSTSSGQR